jgi:hypothetical protein
MDIVTNPKYVNPPVFEMEKVVHVVTCVTTVVDKLMLNF